MYITGLKLNQYRSLTRVVKKELYSSLSTNEVPNP